MAKVPGKVQATVSCGWIGLAPLVEGKIYEAGTAYGSTTYSTEQNDHDISTPYHVNILGGPAYFVQGATEQPLTTGQGNQVWNALGRLWQDCGRNK